MREIAISLKLPSPWQDATFETERVGYLNYLVGPNGSGKSRFAESLRGHLPKCRLLGTDRLTGLQREPGMKIWGTSIDDGGIQKRYFQNFVQAGEAHGFGMDALILLEQKIDLRIRIEALLSRFFDREVSLDWDSGTLIPNVRLRASGEKYRLARDECHGIKELLVLLTILYDDSHESLIIDEPELNLHPQYQAFLMQEVRKVAGDPSKGKKKLIFIITHSPFIIDLRTSDDLRSIISFDRKHSSPKHLYLCSDNEVREFGDLLPSLNVHHKQFFFSDNPVFVEGVFDARMVKSIQETRGVSMEAAGSCVIDVGGAQEVDKYLKLAHLMGKAAYFLYDLDSLYTGSLRACVRADEKITSFLSSLGVSEDFGKACGELDRRLTDLINSILATNPIDDALAPLRSFLNSLVVDGRIDGPKLPRARVALLIQLAADKSSLTNVAADTSLNLIEAKLKQLAMALEERNVFLLTEGALEHYLPSYQGDKFFLSVGSKRQVVEEEIRKLSCGMNAAQIKARYRGLFEVITKMPGQQEVDYDSAIRAYLSDIIHHIQRAVVEQRISDIEGANALVRNKFSGFDRLFVVDSIQIQADASFSAIVRVLDRFGIGERLVAFSNTTNAGIYGFDLRPARVQ